jgi:epoxyqueuosine reductase
VRGAAVWAARRLLDAEAFALLTGPAAEEDETVRAEWAAAG